MTSEIVKFGEIDGVDQYGLLSQAENPIGVILHLHGFPGGPYEENDLIHHLFMNMNYSILSEPTENIFYKPMLSDPFFLFYLLPSFYWHSGLKKYQLRSSILALDFW